jgi:hypothetical protein
MGARMVSPGLALQLGALPFVRNAPPTLTLMTNALRRQIRKFLAVRERRYW